MKKFFLTLILLIFVVNCGSAQFEIVKKENNLTVQTQLTSGNINSNSQNPTSDKEESQSKYPGITIDQKFPIIANHDYREEDFDEKTYSVNAGDLQITVKNFAPKTISKNGKILFSYETRYSNDYYSNLIGISHLLGENSKEVYVATTGPGAVCCTNYWITDVSSGTPRNIFRSEDFGGFRDPMEVFDADGDGNYEIMQWDSIFRSCLKTRSR